MAIFENKLTKARTDRNLTQTQVAAILGVTPPRISQWERGVRTPKPLTQLGILARLARVTQAEIEALAKPRKKKSAKAKPKKKAARKKANCLTRRQMLARLEKVKKHL